VRVGCVVTCVVRPCGRADQERTAAQRCKEVFLSQMQAAEQRMQVRSVVIGTRGTAGFWTPWSGLCREPPPSQAASGTGPSQRDEGLAVASGRPGSFGRAGGKAQAGNMRQGGAKAGGGKVAKKPEVSRRCVPW
jgi:hypothetical protein